MSKITGSFLCEIHEEYGELGLRPTWVPNADPLNGIAVAHDLLEHFPGDDGGVEAEFMALGASVLIRGNTGYYARDGNINTIAGYYSGDFVELYRHVAHEDFTLLDPGTVPPVDDEEIDRILEKATRLGLETIREEESYSRLRRIRPVLEKPEAEGQASDEDDEDESVTLFCSDQSRDRILGWMRKGYTKAQERYADVDIYTLAYEVFNKIETRVDKWLNSGECEGHTLDVEIDLDCLSVTLEAGYGDEGDVRDCGECDEGKVDGEDCEDCGGSGEVDDFYRESI